MSAKPLKWYKPTDHPQDSDGAICMAHGIGGRYHITGPELLHKGGTGYLLWWADDEFAFEEFRTLHEAKSEAESHWQKSYSDAALIDSRQPDLKEKES